MSTQHHDGDESRLLIAHLYISTQHTVVDYLASYIFSSSIRMIWQFEWYETRGYIVSDAHLHWRTIAIFAFSCTACVYRTSPNFTIDVKEKSLYTPHCISWKACEQDAIFKCMPRIRAKNLKLVDGGRQNIGVQVLLKSIIWHVFQRYLFLGCLWWS